MYDSFGQKGKLKSYAFDRDTTIMHSDLDLEIKNMANKLLHLLIKDRDAVEISISRSSKSNDEKEICHISDSHIRHLNLATAMYRSRQRREKFLGQMALFGEPAWDMMLDLYIAFLKSKRVSVTSACLAASVPLSTGLRWIALLEKCGLTVRINDATDGRRTYVELAESGLVRMRDFFNDFDESFASKL